MQARMWRCRYFFISVAVTDIFEVSVVANKDLPVNVTSIGTLTNVPGFRPSARSRSSNQVPERLQSPWQPV